MMKFPIGTLLIAAISSHITQTCAFSPTFYAIGNVPKTNGNQPMNGSVGGGLIMKPSTTTMYSTGEGASGEGGAGEGEQDKASATPTPNADALTQKSESFTEEPIQPRRLDPLVASLTRDDTAGTATSTTKVPLLGEIPADGSLVVLAPVALIAVVGFIMSINIALNSKDAISQQIEQVNTVLSTPPVKKEGSNDNGCRGLCSNQDDQLDSMSRFMNNLAPKKE